MLCGICRVDFGVGVSVATEPPFLNYPPSSGIAPCVGTTGKVT